MSLDPYDWLTVLAFWRFFLPVAIAAAVGLIIFYATGQAPASAAVAFGLGLFGLCIGTVWQIAARRES